MVADERTLREWWEWRVADGETVVYEGRDEGKATRIAAERDLPLKRRWVTDTREWGPWKAIADGGESRA